MKQVLRTIACGAVTLALFTAGCGGKESVASKSAAAYREARAKGVPVGGGHDHGGDAAGATTTDRAGVSTDASSRASARRAGEDTRAPLDAHAGMNHGAAGAAIDHAAMGHGTTGGTQHGGHDSRRTGAAIDHAATGHGTASASEHGAHTPARTPATTDHAAMGHGTAAPADQHAAMQHAAPAVPTADPHAQHRMPAAVPPQSSTAIGSVQPWSTLQPDVFDAPAPIAVSEAMKASQGGGHEGHEMRGITPGEDHENPPTPMPATRDRTTAPAVDHSQHDSTASPAQEKRAADVVYTCPMHPEVISDKPGTCPKCGMALVKKQ